MYYYPKFRFTNIFPAKQGGLQFIITNLLLPKIKTQFLTFSKRVNYNSEKFHKFSIFTIFSELKILSPYGLEQNNKYNTLIFLFR